MFHITNYNINQSLIDQAVCSIPDIDFRLAINQPSSDFFYDPWIIKPEFKGTIWQHILDSIPEDKGEARLIKLEPGTCYRSHADIDDRWHLSLTGEKSYLVNLESNILYPTVRDNHWHVIDTSIKHSAVNFGSKPRVQLVVRKLLTRNILKESITVSITLKEITEDRRFVFDDVVSPWLNEANKNGTLYDFKFEEFEVLLVIEKDQIEQLRQAVQSHFNLEIKE